MGASASFLESRPYSSACKTFLKVFSPIAAKDEQGKRARSVAWRSIDPNGNGQVSLAEADGWVRHVLEDCEGTTEGERIWRFFRPSYIRAFNDAKDMGGRGKVVSKGGATEGDYVQKRELRGLISYFCIYAIMYDAFEAIDGGGNAGDDDRKIVLNEWVSTWKKIKGFGFSAIEEIHSDKGAEAFFSEMDSDGKGAVLLAEFCAAIERGEKEAGTAWGELLTFGEETALGPEEAAEKRKKKLRKELEELRNVAAKVQSRIRRIEAELGR